MAAPLPLYVDEISPDKIKATVSTSRTVRYNLRVMLLVRNPFHAHSYMGTIDNRLGEEINGICIVPIGRFICMMAGKEDGKGMILLDLAAKADLAEKMAEKLGHVDLQEKFMEVYDEIVSHPERHDRFRLIVGLPPLLP